MLIAVYFHSLLSYGILFWGSSHITRDVFRIQKRALRIITNNSRRTSCRPLFKKLNILTLTSQYIYSILIFVAENKNQFETDKEIYSRNTRHSLDLHIPFTRLSVAQRSVLYMGCKIFNSLPTQIKIHNYNLRRFKENLKNYLCRQSLYSLE